MKRMSETILPLLRMENLSCRPFAKQHRTREKILYITGFLFGRTDYSSVLFLSSLGIGLWTIISLLVWLLVFFFFFPLRPVSYTLISEGKKSTKKCTIASSSFLTHQQHREELTIIIINSNNRQIDSSRLINIEMD